MFLILARWEIIALALAADLVGSETWSDSYAANTQWEMHLFQQDKQL